MAFAAHLSLKKKRKKKRKTVTCAPQSKAQKRAAAKRAAAKSKKTRKPVHAKQHCAPPKKKKAKKKIPVVAPAPATPPVVPSGPPVVGSIEPPVPVGPPPQAPPGVHQVPVYSGPFGRRQAERLLWRAGFGPRPGQGAEFAAGGLQAAVQSLTRPTGAPNLIGPEPDDGSGGPLYPSEVWGHDLLWWLDRMARSEQPLVERMTLIWHDWFATSRASITYQSMMIDQNQLFRARSFSSFRELAHAVTADSAMTWWLNLIDSRKENPNENYARELMELFTLGADRGAYTEQDVREMARAFTGWTWEPDPNAVPLGYSPHLNPQRHDAGSKTVFGKTGNWGTPEAVDLCIDHPLHASFFVTKLWSYFIPTPPPDDDLLALEKAYVDSGHLVRPILEAILMHPALYTGEDMIKPPAVFVAGLLRNRGAAVSGGSWIVYLDMMDQRLFMPPSVAGWNDLAWMNPNTARARWSAVNSLLAPIVIWDAAARAYDVNETPQQAVQAARAFWDDPPLSDETLTELQRFAQVAVPAIVTNGQAAVYTAQRQNALRMLVGTCPDAQWC